MADSGINAGAGVPGGLGCELAAFLLADLSWVDCADERCRPEVLPTAGEGVVEAFLAAWRDTIQVTRFRPPAACLVRRRCPSFRRSSTYEVTA
jgi:hypothetical protein